MQDTQTLASNCYLQIRKLILNGHLHPGEKLKGEYLRQKLQVGLSPIREALSKLTATGLVELKDNVGFKVASISTDLVYDAVKTFAKIECLLLREAIENASEVWESNIVAALYRLAKVEKRDMQVAYSIWSIKNEEFHDVLVSGCSLNGLRESRNHFETLKNWYNKLAYSDMEDQLIMASHSEHAKIAELAIARNKDAACLKLYTHLMQGVDMLVFKLEENGFLL